MSRSSSDKGVPSPARNALARIMVVDDHPIVRIGLAALISTLDGMETVAQAGNGAEAILLITSTGRT